MAPSSSVISLKSNSCETTDDSLLTDYLFVLVLIGLPPLSNEGRLTPIKFSAILEASKEGFLEEACLNGDDFSFILTKTCKSNGDDVGRSRTFSNLADYGFSKLKETCFYLVSLG